MPVDTDVLTADTDNKKRIDELMEQVGLHPSQVAFRQQMGLENSADDAQPKDLINSAPKFEAPAKSSISLPAPQLTAPPISLAASKSSSEPLINTGPAKPDVDQQIEDKQNSLIQGSQSQVGAAQKELARMQATGSGISQIKNPFLRTLARVGDIAGSALFPTVASMIPGTELHHRELMGQEGDLIDMGLTNEKQETEAEHQRASADGKITNDLELWHKQNPNRPITDYWREKGKSGSPEEKTFTYLTETLKMDPVKAMTTLAEIKNDTKPDNKTQQEQNMQALLQKAFPAAEQMDPKFMSNTEALAKGITSSSTLTPDEKGKLYSYFVMHSSPASQGTSAGIRGEALLSSKIASYLDTKSNTVVNMNAKDFNEHNAAEPGRFIEAKTGMALQGKEAIFQDMYFNESQTRQALQNLKNGFDTRQRAQISLMLKSNDPHSALDSFLTSSVGKTLSEDQMEYITALASLQENALALRGIAGMGQGSDELRAAILKTLPGANTPTLEYGNRQLDLFRGTLQRLEKGIPAAGTGGGGPGKGPEAVVTPPPETKQKTLSKAQVEQAAKDAKITYEEAKKDAEKHGYTVNEE